MEDHIAAWMSDNQEKIYEVLLSEEMAYILPNPVLIINNASSSTISVKNTRLASEIKGNTQNTRTNYYDNAPITQYRITERYDKWGRSEYSYVIRTHYTNGYVAESVNRTEIAEIKKKDIGKTFNPTDKNLYVPFINVAGVYVATFEYDWYASLKNVYVDGPSGQAAVEVRTTGAGDYYQRFYLPKGQTVTRNEKGTITAYFPPS